MAVETVLNTRKLLRGFRKTGTFASPNALVAPEYLESQIADLVFHCPTREQEPFGEKLCMIRKR